MSKLSTSSNLACHVLLVRNFSSTKQIIGTLLFYNEKRQLITTLRCLELPDKGNTVRQSCIPLGQYIVERYLSPRYGRCFRVLDVPNRTGILFHMGNYHYQSLGCILVGENVNYINSDNELDVAGSMRALHTMVDVCEKAFTMDVIKGY